MTGQSPRDLDWPTRRWLLWGLAAVGGLIVIVVFFIWLGSEEETEPPPAVGEQIEWAVPLTDMSGQTVTLKADLPAGITTETWVDELQLERGTGDRWEWDMEAELPEPVVEIDAATGCDALNALLDEWLEGIGAAFGEIFNWQARAFTQHTIDRMRAEGCEIDDSAITGV